MSRVSVAVVISTVLACSTGLITSDVHFKRFIIARGWHLTYKGDLPVYYNYTGLHKCIYTCMKTDTCQAIGYKTRKKKCTLVSKNIIVHPNDRSDDFFVFVKDAKVIDVKGLHASILDEVQEACNTLGGRMITKDELIAAVESSLVACRCHLVDSGRHFKVRTGDCGGASVEECTNKTLDSTLCTVDNDV